MEPLDVELQRMATQPRSPALAEQPRWPLLVSVHPKCTYALDAVIDFAEEYFKDCRCCSLAKSRSSVFLPLSDSQPMLFGASSLLELEMVGGL
jgi:hypothetical protein